MSKLLSDVHKQSYRTFLCFLNKWIHSKINVWDIWWNASIWLCFVYIKTFVYLAFFPSYFCSICLSLDYNVPHMNTHQKPLQRYASTSFTIVRGVCLSKLSPGILYKQQALFQVQYLPLNFCSQFLVSWTHFTFFSSLVFQ